MTADPVKIYIALPAMNELENMEPFIHCCKNQTYQNFKLVICVNQPDDWWERENKLSICRNNTLSIEFLKKIKDLPIEIIDRSSRGKGWTGKDFGVGWARKTVMDYINKDRRMNMTSLSVLMRIPGLIQTISVRYWKIFKNTPVQWPYQYHTIMN